MARILGISGSLRSGSHNATLLRAAAELAPGGADVEIASIHGIPLYDGDIEREQGLPAAVAELKEQIVAADGLLLVTPEYNNGIPGVFKNAIDWLSRPPDDIDRVFGGLPVGLIGAGGGGGTRLSQAAWLPVLRTLGTRPWFGSQLYVMRVWQLVEEGVLSDEDMRERLAQWMAGFCEFVSDPAGAG